MWGLFEDLIRAVKRFAAQPRKITQQGVKVACIILTAFVAWRCLMVATNCESPVVVVLSGSMEPGMYRGDILFLTKPSSYSVGDIVVYKLPQRDIPIVHRIINLHQMANETQTFMLTKGDNNNVDDRSLYTSDKLWLTSEDIMGKAVGYVPSMGMVTILLNEYPAYENLRNKCIGNPHFQAQDSADCFPFYSPDDGQGCLESDDFFTAMNKPVVEEDIQKWRTYISIQYGPRNCEKLIPFLTGPDSQFHVLIGNGTDDLNPQETRLPGIPQCSILLGEPDYRVKNRYIIDFASIIPPLCLNPHADDVILDMCSAPGGKALVIISLLALQWVKSNKNPGVALVLNESSRERFHRNIRDYASDSIPYIQVMNCNALKQSPILSRHGPYSKIIVDAPCGSDRHVVKAGQMGTWRPGSSRHFVQDQVQLLTIACDLLKLDGTLVYSTCTLADDQNDSVIEKVLKKKKILVRANTEQVEKGLSTYLEPCVKLEFQALENYCEADVSDKPPFYIYRTRLGWIILPDAGYLSGPIYFSVLEKKSSHDLE